MLIASYRDQIFQVRFIIPLSSNTHVDLNNGGIKYFKKVQIFQFRRVKIFQQKIMQGSKYFDIFGPRELKMGGPVFL